MAEFKKGKEKEAESSSKHRFTSICVFGDSKLGKDSEFLKVANDLGKVLAARNIKLMYGGGIFGLRGCVAMSAFISGSQVWGIPVKDLVKKTTFSTIGNELMVASLPEQLGYMACSSEAFIALPGGPETLNGIFNVVYWVSLNFHNKPLGLLNVNGYYDGLLSFLDLAVKQEFISQETRCAIKSASTAEQLIDELQNYAPEPIPPMKQIDWQLPDSSKKQIDCQPPESSKKHKPDTTLRL